MDSAELSQFSVALVTVLVSASLSVGGILALFGIFTKSAS